MSEATELEKGQLFKGRYEVQGVLGTGQRKRTYLAKDTKFDRLVALSVVRPEAQALDPEGTEREARILGPIGSNNNIVSIYEYEVDTNNSLQYSVFEYLAGGRLADQMKAGDQRSLEDILLLARQICRGLVYLHGKGLIHRDVCPMNVFFDEDGNAHLGDFDSAVVIGDLQDRPITINPFAPPEEKENGPLDVRTDLYPIGCLLYLLATGADEIGALDLIQQRRPDLPPSYSDLVATLLAASPEERPADANEVVARLEQIRHDGLAAVIQDITGDDLPQPDPSELRSPLRATAGTYEAGDVINGRFDVLAVVAEGAFGKVYRVWDGLENEERALKLFESATGYEAVRREIGALRKVDHPHVVKVYWADKTEVGEWYLITEFVDGDTLEDFAMGERRLRDREAVDVMLDVLDALMAIHPDSAKIDQLEQKGRETDLSEFEYRQLLELKERGLVHRDVKPNNIILTRTGAKLLDFNIASRVGEVVKTQSGTPAYQAPDANLTLWDASTDLFAVGVILFQLLCEGVHPYPGSRPMVGTDVIDLRTIRPDLDPSLAEFLVTACAPERRHRFVTAIQMRKRLGEIRATL